MKIPSDFSIVTSARMYNELKQQGLITDVSGNGTEAVLGGRPIRVFSRHFMPGGVELAIVTNERLQDMLDARKNLTADNRIKWYADHGITR